MSGARRAALAGCWPGARAGLRGAGDSPLHAGDRRPATPRARRRDFIRPMTAPGCRCASGCPKGRVKAVILALHGFNDYSNAFAGPGDGLGEGRHRHLCLRPARLRRGARRAACGSAPGGSTQDAAIASRLVARALSRRAASIILGESMGGAVAMTAATGAAGAERPVADGIILVGAGGVGPRRHERVRARRRCGRRITWCPA